MTAALDRSVDRARMPMTWYTGLAVFQRKTAAEAGGAPGPWCGGGGQSADTFTSFPFQGDGSNRLWTLDDLSLFLSGASDRR